MPLSKLMHQKLEEVSKVQEKIKEIFSYFPNLRFGQSPSIVFFSCSDSRIDPNKITHSTLGQLFTIRNAGNILSPDGESLASLEYALKGLNSTTDLIICGHSHCGAMKALYEEHLDEIMPHMAKILEYAKIAKQPCSHPDHPIHPAHGDHCDYKATSQANILLQMNFLAQRSSLLNKAHLNIWGWYYDITTGTVEIYDKKSNDFVPYYQVFFEHLLVNLLKPFANPQTAKDYLKLMHLIQRIQNADNPLWPLLKEKLPKEMIGTYEKEILQMKPDLSDLQQTILRSQGYSQYCTQLLIRSCSFFSIKHIDKAPQHEISHQNIKV